MVVCSYVPTSIQIAVCICRSLVQGSITPYGGALYVSSNRDVEITDSTFADNSGRSGGGAAYLKLCTTLKIERSQFLHNTASVRRPGHRC